MAQSATSPWPPGPVEPYTLNADPPTLALLERLTAEHGRIIGVRSADRRDPSFVLNDPTHIERVLKGNYANYVKGAGFERVKMLLGNGIIVSDGELWRRQRTLIQPAFSRTNVGRLADNIRAHNLELAQHWSALADSHAVIDLTTTMSRYALDVILRAIFSDDLVTLSKQSGGNPFAFLAEDPTRDIRTVVRLRELGRLVQQCVDERRQTGRRPFDFLSMMMDAKDRRTGERMPDRQLLDEVKTLIVAGHETSAGTLNWAWYLLSQHADIAAGLRDEIDTQLPADDFSVDNLMSLDLMPRVLKETLRLYPPVWLFSRRAVAADRLDDYVVPAGTHIFISPYLVHRQPHLWPDPERFDPDRFCGPDSAQRSRAFIPFSAGARRCIGEYFSFVEMQMHLAIMARRFHLHHVAGKPIELDPAVNLRSRHSIMMRIEHRVLKAAA